MKKWIVSVRVVLTEKYEVEAQTPEEAAENYLRGQVSELDLLSSTSVEDYVEEVSLVLREETRNV